MGIEVNWDLTGKKQSERAALQAKAEQDTANAALNNQKAVELGMQNQVSAEQLQQVYAELKGYQDSETGRGRTLQELDYAFKYGNFDGFNKMIATDPIVSKAWKDKAQKIEAFNPYNSNHIDAYKRAGMPEEVLDILKASWQQFDNGASEVIIGEDATTGTKYTSEDIKAIQMAYPIVYRDGQYMATTTQDFVAEAGLLKNIYSGDERNRMLGILDKGKTALQGISQDAYKSKLAKEKAETSKLTAEAGETTQKAEGLKYDNQIKEKILSGEGTAEELALKLIQATDPETYAKLQKSKTELKTAEVGLETAKAKLVETGKNIELKGLEIGEKKQERAEGIITKIGKIESLDNSMASVDKLIDRASILFPDGVVGTVGNVGAEFVPGSKTSDFFKSVETIDSQLWMDAIKEMKGMGALSNAEGERVAKTIANLKSNQSKSQIIENLKVVKNYFNTSKQRAAQGIKVALDAGDTIGSEQPKDKPKGYTSKTGQFFPEGSRHGNFVIQNGVPVKVKQ